MYIILNDKTLQKLRMSKIYIMKERKEFIFSRFQQLPGSQNYYLGFAVLTAVLPNGYQRYNSHKYSKQVCTSRSVVTCASLPSLLSSGCKDSSNLSLHDRHTF